MHIRKRVRRWPLKAPCPRCSGCRARERLFSGYFVYIDKIIKNGSGQVNFEAELCAAFGAEAGFDFGPVDAVEVGIDIGVGHTVEDNADG